MRRLYDCVRSLKFPKAALRRMSLRLFEMRQLIVDVVNSTSEPLRNPSSLRLALIPT